MLPRTKEWSLYVIPTKEESGLYVRENYRDPCNHTPLRRKDNIPFRSMVDKHQLNLIVEVLILIIC